MAREVARVLKEKGASAARERRRVCAECDVMSAREGSGHTRKGKPNNSMLEGETLECMQVIDT